MTAHGNGDFINYDDELFDVLVKTSKVVCADSRSLDFLSYAQAVSQSEDLPSWLPNWAAVHFTIVPLARLFPSTPGYDLWQALGSSRVG